MMAASEIFSLEMSKTEALTQVRARGSKPQMLCALLVGDLCNSARARAAWPCHARLMAPTQACARTWLCIR
jgi:DNA helicase TIP49 (TBP-interacting protein)